MGKGIKRTHIQREHVPTAKTTTPELFTDIPTDATILERSHSTLQPVVSGLNPITFVIPRQGGFINLGETTLDLKLKLVNNDDNGNIDANHACYLTPGWAHAMIKELSIRWNGTPVDFSYEWYAYRAFVGRLIYDDPTVTETSLAAEGWTNDIDLPEDFTANKCTVTHADYLALSPEQKLGLQAAADAIRIFHEGREVLVRIKLFSPLMNLNRFIPPNQELEFQIRLADSKLWTIGEANNQVNFPKNFTETTCKAKLNICHVVLNENVGNTILSMRNKGATYRFPYKFYDLKRYFLRRNESTLDKEGFWGNRVPTRMFIFAVDNRNVQGELIRPPFSFNRLKMKEIRVYVNGKEYPWRDPLELTDDEGPTDRDAYYRFLDAVGIIPADRPMMVKPGMYGISYISGKANNKWETAVKVEGMKTIYGFDLTGSGVADSMYRQPKMGGIVRFTIKTTAVNDRDYSIFVMGEFEDLITVKPNNTVELRNQL